MSTPRRFLPLGGEGVLRRGDEVGDRAAGFTTGDGGAHLEFALDGGVGVGELEQKLDQICTGQLVEVVADRIRWLDAHAHDGIVAVTSDSAATSGSSREPFSPRRPGQRPTSR